MSEQMARRVALASSSLLAVCATVYGALWFADFGLGGRPPWASWAEPEAMYAIGSFAGVVVGVLGIVITVVALLVQLAATRYTPRITQLFVADPVNVTVMGLFVVTTVVVVWIGLSLHGEPYPRVMALAAVALVTASLLLILPYFAYVFDFLGPTQVIRRIGRTGSAWMVPNVRPQTARAQVALAVEQLGDIALNSVDNKDKPLALAAVAGLERLALHAIEAKSGLTDAWFDTEAHAHSDQDLIALHPDVVQKIGARKTWVEMKVFRQYQSVFGEALNKMRDVNHLVGIHTRHVAVAALDAEDEPARTLAIRFLNTYCRAAINAQDVRTAYNLLNEYRALGLEALDRDQQDLAVELASYLRFYGQLAFRAGLPFVLETAAFDLGALLVRASEVRARCHDALLTVFLDLDREPEGKAQESGLRGVRKAQIKLATWYLAAGLEAPARRIAEDLRQESPERLRSIRAELEAVVAAEYWEVSDRGENFEWLPEAQRRHLGPFFAWLEVA